MATGSGIDVSDLYNENDSYYIPIGTSGSVIISERFLDGYGRFLSAYPHLSDVPSEISNSISIVPILYAIVYALYNRYMNGEIHGEVSVADAYTASRKVRSSNGHVYDTITITFQNASEGEYS